MLSIWTTLEAASMDKVTEKIYIGNEQAAQEKKMLKDKKVTHILVAGNELQKSFPSDFKYLQLPLDDYTSQDLTPYFLDAYKFIEEAEVVLVHCAAGVSRSSSIVIAYLMMKNKWRYRITYDFVKKKRPIICPNTGFVTQLAKLEEAIKAGEYDASKSSTETISTTS